MDKYYSTEGVMDILHVCRRTAVSYMHQMTHVNTGGKLLVTETALEDWIASHTREPRAPVSATDYSCRPRYREGLDDNVFALPNGHIPTRAQERELRRQAEERKRRRKRA